MNTLKTALVLIGTTIGAGFITGAELLRFFHEGYLGALFLSCLLYFFVCVFFLRLGRKYGGYEGALRALFRSAAPAVRPLPAAATPVPTAVPAKAQTAGRATVSAELQPPVPASYEAQAVEAVADDENPTPEN